MREGEREEEGEREFAHVKEIRQCANFGWDCSRESVSSKNPKERRQSDTVSHGVSFSFK